MKTSIATDTMANSYNSGQQVMLTEEQKRKYQEDGYLVIPNLLTEVELKELSVMVDHLLDGELKPELAYKGKKPDDFFTGWEPNMQNRMDLPRRERVRLMSWMSYYHPYFWQFACHPHIYGVLSELFGGGVQVFSDTVFMKPARRGIAAAAHQDTAFWPKLDPKAINFWLAVDPATVQNGCLHVIPGTHKEDIPHQKDPVMSWYLRDDQMDLNRQIALEMSPGSAAFMDSALVHQSYPNRSDMSRRAMTAVYVAEGVRHVEPWTLERNFKLIPPPNDKEK